MWTGGAVRRMRRMCRMRAVPLCSEFRDLQARRRWSRYERTWAEVVQNASALSKKVAVSLPSGGSGRASRPYMYSMRASSMRTGTHCGCAPAQAQDAGVKKFADRCAESQANWGVLQAELAALDGTQKAVAAVRADMESMCAALKVLDEALDAHIQAKEERDMYKWKAGMEQKNAEFEAGREADLAQMERNLKAEQVRQEKLKKAEEDRILREIEARERREAALKAEAERKEKVQASHARRALQPAPFPNRLVPSVLCCASCPPPGQRANKCTWPLHAGRRERCSVHGKGCDRQLTGWA